MSLLEVEVARWPNTGDDAVLSDVSLTIEQGELVVVTGESGSGKSSLLRCAVGFESFDGSLRWRGEPVIDFVKHRKNVGFLHQRPVRVADSLDENLKLSREHGGWNAEKQRQALADLGLREWSGSERFDRLSGGEQQRFALVRLLSTEPSVLLLDEPTASVDGERARQIEGFIREWRDEERAIVWVTHDGPQRDRLLQWRNSRHLRVEVNDG